MPEVLLLKYPNLESLHFAHENSFPWIIFFSEHMKSLKLSLSPARETPMAMLFHYTFLRQLILEGVELPATGALNVWEHTGESLEILALNVCYSGEEDLRNIGK